MHQYVRLLSGALLSFCSIAASVAADTASKLACASPAAFIGDVTAGAKWYDVSIREKVDVKLEIDRLAALYNIQPKVKKESMRGFYAKLTPELVDALRCVSSVASLVYADVIEPAAPANLVATPIGGAESAIDGTIYVRVLVGADGQVKEAVMAAPSTHPKLAEAVLIEAKQKWRFTPGTDAGKPVEAWVTVPIKFKLSE